MWLATLPLHRTSPVLSCANVNVRHVYRIFDLEIAISSIDLWRDRKRVWLVESPSTKIEHCAWEEAWLAAQLALQQIPPHGRHPGSRYAGGQQCATRSW
jgi:hypothetical protein